MKHLENQPQPLLRTTTAAKKYRGFVLTLFARQEFPAAAHLQQKSYRADRVLTNLVLTPFASGVCAFPFAEARHRGRALQCRNRQQRENPTRPPHCVDQLGYSARAYQLSGASAGTAGEHPFPAVAHLAATTVKSVDS
jgi:hypothetical protein